MVDQSGEKVGSLSTLWADHSSNQPAYLGVQTGWMFGKTHVVPVEGADVNEQRRTIRLPYTSQQIKDAPAYAKDVDLDPQTIQQVRSYYSLGSQRTAAMEGANDQRPRSQRQTEEQRQEAVTMQLREEQLKVGKRQVEAGGIRLRKIIKTETVNQPVELKREEIVIERVSGSQNTKPCGTDFQQQDIYIPLMREEAVIQKDSKVREEVRVSKKSETDRRTISEQVRKEEVQVDRQGNAPRGNLTGTNRTSGRTDKVEKGGRKAVFGLARSEQQASQIVDELKRAGFGRDDISVLFPDRRGSKDFAHEKNTKAPEGATTGAGTGGILGGALGWLAGIGALAIPGAGPFIAAGPIMAALSGAAIGAGTGGVIGALVGLGIPEYEAKRYEGKLKDGRVLISVHSENSEETSRAKEILERAGAEDVSATSEEKVAHA